MSPVFQFFQSKFYILSGSFFQTEISYIYSNYYYGVRDLDPSSGSLRRFPTLQAGHIVVVKKKCGPCIPFSSFHASLKLFPESTFAAMFFSRASDSISGFVKISEHRSAAGRKNEFRTISGCFSYTNFCKGVAGSQKSDLGNREGFC